MEVAITTESLEKMCPIAAGDGMERDPTHKRNRLAEENLSATGLLLELPRAKAQLLSLKHLCMLAIASHEGLTAMCQGQGGTMLERLLPQDLIQELQEFQRGHRVRACEGAWRVTLTIEREVTRRILLPPGRMGGYAGRHLARGVESFSVRDQGSTFKEWESVLELLKDVRVEKSLQLEELSRSARDGRSARKFSLCNFKHDSSE